MNKFDSHIVVKPDGLYTPEVHDWSLKKYKLVGSYCDIFTTGMKNQWKQMVYIDLFAGAGYAKMIEGGKTYLNSALIAMSIPNPFTKYILCERDPERFAALSARVKRDFGHLNVELINEDSNESVKTVISKIPAYNKDNPLLRFCFADPFDLNLNFNTIKSMASGLIDFLILQALHMDGNRWEKKYLEPSDKRIEKYLGVSNWRELYNKNTSYKGDFVRFLADQYQLQMKALGYGDEKLFHQIRSNKKNLALYYLTFFSKHPRGEQFFQNVKKNISFQHTFDFDNPMD